MMRAALSSGVAGAVAGFVTRPCCVIPAALSLAGMGSAGLANAAVAYQPVFVAFSVATVVGSVWMTFRREGGWFNRCLSMAAAILGFVVASRFAGVL